MTQNGFSDSVLLVQANRALGGGGTGEAEGQGEAVGEGEGEERKALFTTPSVAPRVRVDYCFVRGQGVGVEHVAVLKFAEGREPLSDHRPVVFDLVLA